MHVALACIPAWPAELHCFRQVCFGLSTRVSVTQLVDRDIDSSCLVPRRRVKGKTLDEVLTITNSDIAKHLSLPPVKLHCSMLAEDAVKV